MEELHRRGGRSHGRTVQKVWPRPWKSCTEGVAEAVQKRWPKPYPRMLLHLKMSCSRVDVNGLLSHARMLVQSVTSCTGIWAALEKWPASAFCNSAARSTSKQPSQTLCGSRYPNLHAPLQ